jgi:RNA polymerase sigma-70 factor (ECF subfamily)
MDQVYDLQSLSDEELLSRSLSAPSAFEILVTRYRGHFIERAGYVVKSKDDAEDVVQETFIRIYRFAPRFDGSAGTFRAWATTILMNVARTRYQKQATHRGRVAPLLPEQYESIAAPSGKDAALARDTVERALEKAPDDIALILKMAYIEELPYQEIAERLAVSVGAVKTRVHRAKKLLRGIIGTV